ncbi:MAG TPA: hypothetical protein VGQ76_22920 [Thermoanaerobaculia bacterium]|nr:hypothetical protein [Thermoanaerobaculia bacterium]
MSDRVEIVTAEDVRVRRMRLELVDAASLEVPVGESEVAFVWIPQTRSAMPVVGPVPAALLVPVVISRATGPSNVPRVRDGLRARRSRSGLR